MSNQQQPPSGSGEGPGEGGRDGDGEGPRLPSAPPPGEGPDESGSRYDTPYGPNPYGGAEGAADPLAGMPPLAALGRRLLARLIDALLVGVPAALILWPLMGDWDFGNNGNGDGGAYLQQSIVLVVYFVYEGLMLSARGQTVGKMAMKIRVAILDNGTVPHGGPGWFRAAVYALPQLVPCIGFLFWLLNVLYCTWDRPYRQCIHDKAAKTVVVSAA
ncbi:RDD family protein [Streptomyces sp. 6N223]|uniref:RDD family protein n=1 Tax=Streptomyces sp. 6N223 TaxID=3457412 RepID=UPI003FD188BE